MIIVHKRSHFLLFTVLACAFSAYASEIHGAITDPLGAVVPNAKVTLRAGTQILETTVTDPAGEYSFSVKRAGRVRVYAEAETFAPAETEAFYLTGGNETVTRNLLLGIKSVSEQIVVSATGVPTAEAQVGASISTLAPQWYLARLDVLDPLHLVPGLQLTQTGQHGGTTALFIRGGNSNANKVLIDGIPVNDIGGEVEFSDLAASGISNIEVLRGPNSVLYGADALAGVINLTTRKGITPSPLLEYAADGGNFGTYHQDGSLSGAWRKFDYYSDFSRLDSSNSLPNSGFHNSTVAANLGWAVTPNNSFGVTLRRISTGVGLPNAIDLFGVPDNATSSDHDTFVSATFENHASSRWHNLIRYGASRLTSQFEKPSPVGILINGFEFVGSPVTIRGANGFTASGQAFLTTSDCCPSLSESTGNRDFVYAQTDYRFNQHLDTLAGFRYEAERGISNSSSPSFSSNSSVDRRNMSWIMEFHGDFWNRLFYSLGGGIEKNAVFGVEGTPRASLAYYPFHNNAGLFRGTKFSLNFGKGIKEPSIFDQNQSLFNLLLQQPGGIGLIDQFHIRPIGAERSRSFDIGAEQRLGDRIRLTVTLFHNQFTNEVEFVSSDALPALGVPPAVAAASGFGATINSSDFRAMGIETEIEYRITSSIRARGGYTYLDARVQRSFSSDALAPSFNPAFPEIPIGAFSPLVGARPFRRAPHTGFIAIAYERGRFSGLFQGTFVGRRDDSTFLLFSDANFGNSLLLPNRNLDFAYQKLDLSAMVRLTSYAALYTSLENLLNQSYDAAFGFRSLPFTVRAGVKLTFGGESWHRK
jgi:iron complex outermembrane receptor protein/vitamin B12 transporter